MPSFARLEFDDLFLRSLPGDLSRAPGPRAVLGAAWSTVDPTPVAAPRLLAWSGEVGALLGADRPGDDADEIARILGGNALAAGMRPYAACYGGHQFGNWANQLGDGRAITLGEVVRPASRWEVQLKGAGPTPYSRGADGRAVLRSSIREFICSEAMAGLGVPTTRALALVDTGEGVVRDMFYDGRPRREPGAIVTRVAPSFVRFGNFELAAARRDVGLLRGLADFVISTYYPELGAPGPETYLAWFTEIARRTAVMIAHWMRVGFVHGVMNTDNMSILGLTIDYGPFGWLDTFDPDFTPNTTDAGMGRYRFANQPSIGLWNLAMLARALGPLVEKPQSLEVGLETYRVTFESTWLAFMRDKLGLVTPADDDEALVGELLQLLQAAEIDPTLWYRALMALPDDPMAASDAELHAAVAVAFYQPLAMDSALWARTRGWLHGLGARWRADGSSAGERAARQARANPLILPRNFQLQEAIDLAEAGDPSGIGRLLDAVRTPYEQNAQTAPYVQKRPDWARDRPGCSALSCSS